MKKLPLCDCGREGFKKVTNGSVCKRCHDIEKRLYKDARQGNLFKLMGCRIKSNAYEIGKFSLS